MSRVLPILFNTEMVRAILDGRKTATRRLTKNPPHPDMPDNHNYCRMQFFAKEYLRTLHYMDAIEQNPFRRTRYFESLAPYDKGDILYVRETWCNANKEGEEPDYYYYADVSICEDYNSVEWKWRPSIHMPKEAARIWLKVKGVRVEQINDMTLDDFLREGAVIRPEAFNDPDNAYRQAKNAFIDIWDSTIRKPDLKRYSWDANPWVWATEFEWCEKPEGEA